MKKVSITTLAYCFSFGVFAQTALKIKDGEKSEVFSKKYGLIGDKTNGFVTLEINKNSFGIQGYNIQTMTPTNQVKVDFDDNERKSEFIKTVSINNKHYILYCSDRISKDATLLFAKQIDTKNNNLFPKSFELINESKAKRYKPKEFTYRGPKEAPLFDIYTNESESDLSVTYIIKPEGKKDNQKIYVANFDDNLNNLWNKELEIPYPANEIEVLKTKTDAKGNLFVLIDHIKEKKDNPDKHELIIFGNNSKSKSVKLNFQKKNSAFTNINTRMEFGEKNGTIVLCGLYYTNLEKLPAGFFTLNLSNIDNITINNSGSVFPFDSKIILERENSKSEDRGGSRLFQLTQIQQVDISNDGKIKIFAEENTILTFRRNQSEFSTNPDNQYQESHFGNIYIMEVENNKQNWFVKVNKKQKFVNIGGILASFSTISKPEGLYVLYNDHDKNLDETREEVATLQGLGCILVYTFIDNNGKRYKKEQIFVEKAPFYIVNDLKKISNTEYIITKLNISGSFNTLSKITTN
ncbi:hypothetical protein [Polluticaenibacter yanchengensis]|uniref:Uncharacterized protein n=1 Tax=Polluticaenibacter yanchengensis TaxID=3014562 RepID=A0ABT4UJ75_9BACT|nr:hypothetical protein [Chitinophagaceae bacterium LY-5]